MLKKIGIIAGIIAAGVAIYNAYWTISTGIPANRYAQRTRQLSFHFDMVDEPPEYEDREVVNRGYRVLFPYKFVNKNPFDVYYGLTWMLIPEESAAESDIPLQKWHHGIKKVAKETTDEGFIKRLAGDTTIDDWFNNKRNFTFLTEVTVWVELDKAPQKESYVYRTLYTNEGGFYWDAVN